MSRNLARHLRAALVGVVSCLAGLIFMSFVTWDFFIFADPGMYRLLLTVGVGVFFLSYMWDFLERDRR